MRPALRGVRLHDRESQGNDPDSDLCSAVSRPCELPAETARNARVAGRVTGLTLRWNTEKREFDAVPLDVSASTEPWERYSRLFGEEIKVPSTKCARKSGNQ